MRKLIFILIIIFCLTTITGHIYAQNVTSEDITSWYKGQLGTGLGQCGPACIAMLIERNGPATTIGQIRAQLPLGPTDGATNFNDLLNVLNSYGIYYEWLNGLSKWSGEGVVMIAFNPYYVSEVPYDYDGGHYILIVGEKDDKYIVNDPLIGSPIRYYSKDEIKNARFHYIIWIP